MPVTSAVFVRTTVVLLFLGFLALLVIVGASLWLVERTDVYSEEVVETQELRRGAFRVVDLAQDAETSQRGYIITGDTAYLEPYLDARSEMDATLSVLRELGSRQPEYGARVASIEALLRDKMLELNGTIELMRDNRRNEAVATVRADSGKDLMDELRSVSDAMIAAIDEELGIAAADMRASSAALTWVLIIGGVLVVAVVGGSAVLAARYTRDLLRAQAEVRALNVGLEERVNERTADLIRANEEIQRFAYIVSHDLRSPLVNIMGFTSELETGMQAIDRYLATAANDDDPTLKEARQALDAEMPEAIGFIRSSTGRMDNLINAILKLSREGRRRLEPQRIEMAKLLDVATDTVVHRLAEGGGEIAVANPVPDVTSDRLAIEQIFGNLIDNAVKYLDPARPGRIVIRGRALPFGVQYEVEDNGRGIAPGDHDRIFELFRRAGAQDQAGEGIGLTHVRALARRLGGDITLESQLGKGTTFRLTLPRNLPLLRETA